MTTQRQAQQIFLRLADHHTDYKILGTRSLFNVPITHIAKRVFIERTSLADDFRLMFTLSALFRPRTNIDRSLGTYVQELFRVQASSQRTSPWAGSLTFSDRLELIGDGPPRPAWRWSDPTMMADAIDVIETEALPNLQLYGTPEGYITLPRREHWVRYECLEDRMLAHIAAGDLETARAIWCEQEPKYRGKVRHPGTLPHRWHMQLATVAEPLHAGDRPALAKILHGWEEANVRGTSVERYWEPTPFPLES